MMLSRRTVNRRLCQLLALALALCVISSRGSAATKKPSIDPNTPEGKLLAKVQAEDDLSKKLALLELFPEMFPASPALEYVWSELQVDYQQAGKPSKALTAGSTVLAYNPANLESACLNWRIAADMKDAAATAVWMSQAGVIAERALETPYPEMSKATLDCGTSARQANEDEAYRVAFTTKNPADRIKLLGEFLKKHPQTKHADDIEISIFLAYREQGDSAKALAAAEKLITHIDTREDAMLVVAESYFKANRDLNTVVSLSKKAIDRLSTAEKPQGMSDADWARTKTAELTQANYMIGFVAFQSEKWDVADQAFRAALPSVIDLRFRAEVLGSLGWANYKLKNISDAVKFYIDCTNIPGPNQQAAVKTLHNITAEYRIK
jgi:tetratricopeptide (TPR) repeat protein